MTESEDSLAFLLSLNLGLAEVESRGKTIIGPGLPAAISAQGLVSTDCIGSITLQ